MVFSLTIYMYQVMVNLGFTETIISYSDDGPGVVVCEVHPLTDLTPEHGHKQGSCLLTLCWKTFKH